MKIKRVKSGAAVRTAADPIPFSVYSLLLKEAVDDNDVMLWFWTLAQWNLGLRLASIDTLRLSDFDIGLESLIGYCENRKSGERLSNGKKVFPNPYDWTQCFWTGLGIWIALRAIDEPKLNNEHDLLNDRNKGLASAKYRHRFLTIVERKREAVEYYMHADRLKPHGLRKGASHAATCALLPQTDPSTDPLQLESGIGGVLDLYGPLSLRDMMVGRVLAGLDPYDQGKFNVLPPHWTVLDPMGDEDIKEGLVITFGNIAKRHSTHLPVLLRVFASVVYHSESLLEVMSRNNRHEFSKMAILQQRSLLQRLREKVTIE